VLDGRILADTARAAARAGSREGGTS
jgi:hypothetical protein